MIGQILEMERFDWSVILAGGAVTSGYVKVAHGPTKERNVPGTCMSRNSRWIVHGHIDGYRSCRICHNFRLVYPQEQVDTETLTDAV